MVKKNNTCVLCGNLCVTKNGTCRSCYTSNKYVGKKVKKINKQEGYGKMVNDVPTEYFDWAINQLKEDAERERIETVLDGLSLEQCLFFTELVEVNSK